MQTSSGRSPATTRTMPVISTLTLQLKDDGEFCLTVAHRRGRRTMFVGTRMFRLDPEGRMPAEVEVWLWGQVQTPSQALANWEEAQLF